MNVAVSWSGGKDSCLACWRAQRTGHHVQYLLNAVYRDLRRVSFHGTPARVIVRQAEALGIPLVQFSVPRDLSNYEAEFKKALARLKRQGVEGIVFGDIYLDGHREWGQRVCDDVGLVPLWPLWGRNTRDLILEFVNSGFNALVVSANGEYIPPTWLGRRADGEFFADLEKLSAERGIDICGERGEYHTLVLDGPTFQQRLIVRTGATVQNDGYWSIDLPRSTLVPK